MRRFLLLAATMLLAACGGDATGPKDASVGGTWRFGWNVGGSTSGVAFACTITGADFLLTQTGTTFTGAQVGTATLICSAPGFADTASIAGETIENGQINRSAITFSLGSIPGQHSGTVSGSTIAGTAQWQLPLETGTMTMSGTFTAAKR